jgi:predicted unusual protein kinase regulating ubiquinone biosynthesis (AarF/ABC1/UbiB family)
MLAIGMTRKKVDTAKLAKDLEDFYHASETYAVDALQAYPPALEEPEQILLDMVRIAEAHGIRFPREFTLLLKQFLYFDSYSDILFDMDMLLDDMTLDLEFFNQRLQWPE